MEHTQRMAVSQHESGGLRNTCKRGPKAASTRITSRQTCLWHSRNAGLHVCAVMNVSVMVQECSHSMLRATVYFTVYSIKTHLSLSVKAFSNIALLFNNENPVARICLPISICCASPLIYEMIWVHSLFMLVVELLPFFPVRLATNTINIEMKSQFAQGIAAAAVKVVTID